MSFVQRKWYLIVIFGFLTTFVALAFFFAPGRLEIKSNIAGFRITVDEKANEAKSTKHTLYLDKGLHSVKVEAPGLEPVDLVVNIKPIFKKVYSITLSKLKFKEQFLDGYGSEDSNYLTTFRGNVYISVNIEDGTIARRTYNTKEEKFEVETFNIDLDFAESEYIANASIDESGNKLIVQSIDEKTEEDGQPEQKSRIVSLEDKKVIWSGSYQNLAWLNSSMIASINQEDLKIFNELPMNPVKTIKLEKSNCSFVTSYPKAYLTCPELDGGFELDIENGSLSKINVEGQLQSASTLKEKSVLLSSSADKTWIYLINGNKIKEVKADFGLIEQIALNGSDKAIVATNSEKDAYLLYEVDLVNGKSQTIEKLPPEIQGITSMNVIENTILIESLGKLYSLTINE